MKTNKMNIIGLAAVLTLAIAAIAFANDGYGGYMGGYGSHMMGRGYGGGYMMGPGYDGGHMMGPGYGGHMMGYDSDDGSYCRGGGAWGNLSDKDSAKLDASQEKFYNETRELRNQIDEKGIALNNEMRKDNPNKDKVFELQKEVSSLRNDFDQKALAHQLEVRKLLPDNFRGSGYGNGRGYCW
ncbi:periplasmic heavy metal sensor [uncultured Desulfosarcina sp.]|uniref:periplasmic heavy metal sensor n=1 Tax=uncultured Desulfosarcina sp. TaxID=218289 RepID=UPI0029C6D6A0|nr:periplasmic heavy metal sensor [uncultured Desulfosarcina sp.]